MNTRKTLSLALCFALLLSCFIFSDNSSTALSGTSKIYESESPVVPEEKDFTYRKIPASNPVKAVISSYSGSETKIILPETLGGLPVTGLSSSAFAKNENLTYIKLPATLETVSGKAFNMCSSLKEIEVDPANQSLASADGVLYRKQTDKNSENYGKPYFLVSFPCGKGGSFTIPRGIQIVGSYAFDHCYNLTSVNMYNTVTEIENNAFSYCWNLKSIRLSDNLVSLGTEALAYCEALKRIDLPSILSDIGEDAVLGTIDSDDNKVYYFTEGISCLQYSYAFDYLMAQALPESIIIQNRRSVTDNDTGIRFIDAYDILPCDEFIDISVSHVEISEVQELFPTRYSRAYAFDISFSDKNGDYDPDASFILNFDSVCENAIPSAAKVYQIVNGTPVLVSASANAMFIGAQVIHGGRFIILVNDDFSLKGDIDGDGRVTLFDAKSALHAAAGTLTLTAEQSVAANADNSADGKITTADARKILRMAGGME